MPKGETDFLLRCYPGSFIAAHALALRVRIVTHNTSGFGRVRGLKIEGWLE